ACPGPPALSIPASGLLALLPSGPRTPTPARRRPARRDRVSRLQRGRLRDVQAAPAAGRVRGRPDVDPAPCPARALRRGRWSPGRSDRNAAAPRDGALRAPARRRVGGAVGRDPRVAARRVWFRRAGLAAPAALRADRDRG